MTQIISGVLFHCTIRSGHASLLLSLTGTCDGVPSGIPVIALVKFGGSDWFCSRDGENDVDLSAASRNTINRTNDDGQRRERITLLRSNIRRMCKIGNELELRGYFDLDPVETPSNVLSSENENYSSFKRFNVEYHSSPSDEIQHPLETFVQQESFTTVTVKRVRKWDARKCQLVRLKYFPQLPSKQPRNILRCENKDESHPEKMLQIIGNPIPSMKQEGVQNQQRAHGGGVGKRKQGEVLSRFLLWMLATMQNNDSGHAHSDCSADEMVNENESGSSNGDGLDNIEEVRFNQKEHSERLWMRRLVKLHSSITPPSTDKMEQTLDAYQSKNGVEIIPESFLSSVKIIDAAGGAGHVSLALALRGIHSTVVDPRPNVGKLPGRDRKTLKKALSCNKSNGGNTKSSPNSIFRNAVPFSTYRAWFGTRPDGVDSVFREGSTDDDIDSAKLPICTLCSDDQLLSSCTAIVALHPDEATGEYDAWRLGSFLLEFPTCFTFTATLSLFAFHWTQVRSLKLLLRIKYLLLLCLVVYSPDCFRIV